MDFPWKTRAGLGFFAKAVGARRLRRLRADAPAFMCVIRHSSTLSLANCLISAQSAKDLLLPIGTRLNPPNLITILRAVMVPFVFWCLMTDRMQFALILFGTLKALPLWLVIAVVSRDILIIVAVVVSWLMNHPVQIDPHPLSKANTVSQIVLAGTVMADRGLGLGLDVLVVILIWTTGLFTVLSLGAYLRTWLEHMSRAE